MRVTPAERPEFTPPPEPGFTRSVALALVAHLLLVLGLSWGVKWQRDRQDAVVEAELWASTAQQAAPKPEPPAPPPPPPQPQVVQPPPPPAPREPDIAVEQRKRQEAQERARQEEAERQRQLAEKRREEQARKQEAAKKQQAEEQARKQEAAKKLAEERRRQEQEQARAQKREEERVAKLREENLRRMQGLANASGAPDSTGTAARSSGPSASYAGRLAAIFQRNVVYPGGVETIAGNPQAIVQVRVSPTGMILSARLVKPSGNASWDEAAVRAIERSERIPPDEDGRFVQDFQVQMQPKR